MAAQPQVRVMGPVAEVPGAADAGLAEVPETPELRDRRMAFAELGGEVRRLIDAAVRAEVATGTVVRTAAVVRELVASLSQRSRPVTKPPAIDDLVGGLRLFNPVIGAANPIAPPLRVTVGEGRAVGECTLGPAYEGPHMYGHGGISALLLDQVLGHAAASVDNVGVTADLSLRYRKPVPLDVPIRVWGTVVEVDGRRTTVTGGITTVAEPDVQLVEADGRFVKLRPDQAKRLFAASTSADAVNPDTAHD